jgi:outer membrane protein OmpA-like peptidoglycan-associated protein
MSRNPPGHVAICMICATALALGACSKPATRPTAPVPAATPSPPPPAPVPPVKPAPAPTVAPAKGPIVLGSRGFEEGKRRIKNALAKDPAAALPPDDVGYYIDVLQGRLKQVAGTQVGMVVGRQDNDVILDLSSRLDFDAGSARITPGIREMLAAIVKVLAEYRMLLVTVNASPNDVGDAAADGAPDIRLAEQRGLAVARHLAGTGVAASRIVVAGSSPARPSETSTLPETRTHLEIHLEPIVRAVDAARPAASH